MDNPKISIIIPVYNGQDFLSEAIDSALSQTYKNIEILVINDGSNDEGTEHVAVSYGDKIRYFYKPNGGVASALNLGISEMTGDYFSWLSHDDLYTENKIETEVSALSEMGGDNIIVYSDYSVFTNNPENAIPVNLKGISPEHFRYWITIENKLHGCTLLIPQRAFDEVGCFNESLKTTQDYDLWFRMAKVFPFVHLPKILVKARSHEGQGSHKMANTAFIECNELLSNFIHSLNHKEIIFSTGKSLPESYEEIARSMFHRGFDKAGKVAEELAGRNNLTVNNKLAAITKNIVQRRRQLIWAIRKMLPIKIKRAIKTTRNLMINRGADKEKKEHEALGRKFSEIYEKNIFGGHNSRSGEGSDLVQTEVIRCELPKIIKKLSVCTFLDAPCGDWYWMRETNLGVNKYIGVDIVESMVEKLTINHGSSSKTFQCLDLATDPLPKADLIFSRDCLVHLKFDDALKIINNFKRSGAKYLLATTFIDRATNNDLVGKDGFWRPINMRLTPFNFPEPILVINEGCTEEGGQYEDKCLCLWLLSDI